MPTSEAQLRWQVKAVASDPTPETSLYRARSLLIQSEERDIIGGGAQSFAKMSFIAEVTERTSWGLKMLEFLGTDDLLYSNNYY